MVKTFSASVTVLSLLICCRPFDGGLGRALCVLSTRVFRGWFSCLCLYVYVLTQNDHSNVVPLRQHRSICDDGRFRGFWVHRPPDSANGRVIHLSHVSRLILDSVMSSSSMTVAHHECLTQRRGPGAFVVFFPWNQGRSDQLHGRTQGHTQHSIPDTVHNNSDCRSLSARARHLAVPFGTRSAHMLGCDDPRDDGCKR